jgi:hypothetical protein
MGPEPVRARRDWRSRELAPGVVLSSCPTLPVEEVDGLVLGIAVRPARDRSTWAGRWAVVRPDLRLELDASGLLGCFYRPAEGPSWVSSSAALLRQIAPQLRGPHPPLDPDDWTRDWYPPPVCGIPSVRKLLPSQTLDLRTGAIEPRQLVPRRTPRSEERIVDELADLLVRLVREVGRRWPELWVSLSGGMDSRLVLAATHAARVPVTVYTNDKPGAISRADRQLPPRLADALGLEHRLIEPFPEEERRLRLFDLHTACQTFDTDRHYFARRHFDQLPPSALVLGGNCWEVGRCAHHREFGQELPDGSSESGRWFAEWLAWVRRNPADSLDWRDRYHIEQKLTGWLSAIEQGIDISGRQRIHLANCGEIFGLLLALPESVRSTGSHQLELIRRLAPELAGFPVNAPESVVGRIRRRLGR